MRKTIAQAEREEARLEAKREMLLRVMVRRFGPLTPNLTAVIQTCTDQAQLDSWMDAFAVAKRLTDVGIQAQS